MCGRRRKAPDWTVGRKEDSTTENTENTERHRRGVGRSGGYPSGVVNHGLKLVVGGSVDPNDNDRMKVAFDRRDAAAFVGLVFALTTPFWLLGAAVDLQVLPGLPLSALAVVCPTIAACLLTAKRTGRAGLARWLSEMLRLEAAGWRWVLVLVINPGLFIAAFLVSRASGTEVPDPTFTLTHALLLLAVFIPTALLEEIGWTGYVLPRLRAGYGVLWSGLVLGVVTAVWHVPALLQVDRSGEWIAWWGLWSVAARIIMVWMYERFRIGVPGVVIYHAMSNLCWQLYPVNGSHFDPRISGILTMGLAGLLILCRPKAPHAAPG